MFARLEVVAVCLIGLACGPESATDSTAGSTGAVTVDSTGDPAPTTGEASSSGTSGNAFACENPTQIAQALADPPAQSGFVRCDNGAVHRVEPAPCAVPITPVLAQRERDRWVG